MGVHAAAKGRKRVLGPKMKLTVNGREIDMSKMEALSARSFRVTFNGEDLDLVEGKEKTIDVRLENMGGPRLFLTARLHYDVPLNEKNRAPSSSGFEISRCYETLDGESLEGKTIPLGSLVRVRVRVKTKKDHHYVAIDDKLPAGLEPLNTNLETTQKVSRGKLTVIRQRRNPINLRYSLKYRKQLCRARGCGCHPLAEGNLFSIDICFLITDILSDEGLPRMRW